MIHENGNVMVNGHSTGKSKRIIIIKDNTINKSERKRNMSFLLNNTR